MRKNKLRNWAVAALALAHAAPSLAAKIVSVDFKGTQSPNLLEIRSDGAVTVDRSDNAQDKQIILDIHGATITKSAGREIDTSSFNSRITLVKSYAVQGEPDHVRVVVQLREPAEGEVTQEGNLIRLSVPAPGGASASASGGPSGGASADAPPAMDGGSAPPADDTATVSPKARKAARVAKISSSGADADAAQLDAAIDVTPGHRYIGKPITLKVREMDAADVFRLIGESSGFNIVLAEDVKGKLTLSLEDVPWDQALAVVLQTLRLGAERVNNVLRITTLENLTAARQAAYKAALVNEAATPRITRVFSISYAKLDDLVSVLERTLGIGKAALVAAGVNAPGGAPGADPIAAAMLTSAGGGAAGGGKGAGAGANSTLPSTTELGSKNLHSIVADNRTNSLIVRDTAANIERIRKLIEILDVQTPQVLIEGKVVEANESFSNSINGNLGGGASSGGGTLLASANGGLPQDPLLGSPSPGGFSNTSAIAAQSAQAGTIALSFLPGTQRLNAVLNLAEQENQTKVLAAPRTVVLNKEKANIVSSQPVLVATTVSTGNGSVGPGVKVDEAKLSLEVMPTVTNDGNILMDLMLQRDVPVSLTINSGIAGRKINTQVLVESGSTLVLGGFYTMSSSHGSSGFPVLRKIPILGWLFGSESDQNDRTELFFFVTPQILNGKKAGIEG